MSNYYKKSKKIFRKKISKNKELTRIEWDDFAHENCLFSAITIMAHEDVATFDELKEKFS